MIFRKHKAKSKAKATNSTNYYNMLIVGTLVLAFLLIALVYLKILNDSLVSEKLSEMDRMTLAIQEDLAESSSFQNSGQLSRADEQILKAMGKGSDMLIWLVKPSGKFVYMNHLPEEAVHSIIYKSNDGYYLQNSHLINEGLERGVTLSGGNFFGVFSEDSGHWLTQVRPVYDHNGRFSAYLSIHYSLNSLSLSDTNVILGLAVMLLMGILVGVVIIKGYVSRVTRPIDLLAEAANRVGQGDLSYRIQVDHADDVIMGQSHSNDDWMNLILTFNRMIDQIEQQNLEQRDFVASISHDLRTPLTSISGFITAILDGTIPPEKQTHYLETVQEETKRLTSLVQDMNTTIRLENNQENMAKENFNINALIHKVIESLRVLLDEKNIQVQINFKDPEKNERLVYADPKQIERVLYNLISNAIEFLSQDGIILVTTRAQGSNLLITVEDNGPGIRPEDLPYVFDRFYKSDKSRTGRKGSGLGLYICKKILQSHGQSIYAGRSDLGGAKFEFTLALGK